MGAFCHPQSRRVGRWRGKIPGMLLRQCPVLLPGEENPWNPEAPAVPVWDASPWQSRFYRAGNAKWYRRGSFFPLLGSLYQHKTAAQNKFFPPREAGALENHILETSRERATKNLKIVRGSG